MHIEFAEQAQEWGEWAFGDLAAATCRAVEIVGPAANVLGHSAVRGSPGAPRVLLLVPDVDEVARLREEAMSGEYAIAFVGQSCDKTWEADIHGIRLSVAVALPEELS